MKLKELKKEFMQQFDTYDCWGAAMSAWFGICGELYLRGEDIPQRWEFRPSPMGIERDIDSYWESEVLPHATADALIKLGNILERYTRNLKRLGRDY